MNRPIRRFMLFLAALISSLTVFFACHLGTTQEVEETFTFPTLKDSIGTADSVLILLKDQGGRVVDTLFNDKVTASTRFTDLKARNYDGGKVFIFIEATENGKLVYKVDRGFDPALGGNLEGTKIVHISPSLGIRMEKTLGKLREGDSVPLPGCDIVPPNLSDKSLVWVSRNPATLKVDGLSLKALIPGKVFLVAALQVDTTKKDSLQVEVIPKNAPVKPIDSLVLSPEFLTLALGGPSGRLTLSAVPASASTEATWSLVSGNSVLLSPDGLLTPVEQGVSKVAAVSALDASVWDTASIQVLPRQTVDSVRFGVDSLDLFVGGAAEPLLVDVHPRLSPQGVNFTIRDTSLARIRNGFVEGLKEGETWVVASSSEDPSKKDSVKLLLYPSEKVDSVRLKEDTLKLYVKGESKSLAATIHPAILKPRFLWRTGHLATASVDPAGLVIPGQEGKTYITAVARADSTKKDSALVIVKKDTPRLWVGGDTLIAKGSTLTYAPEAPQDYGLVVMFKWDLNGDGAYEDSATSVRDGLSYVYSDAKAYPVRFYVRDTEGNDTVVTRKVTAVSGRVVQITSPKDGAYVKEGPITVTWKVDSETQSNSQDLTVGANTITRSAKDESGLEFSHSITVFLDKTAPGSPSVKGPAFPVNSLKPRWTWSSGGNGGSGIYRFSLNNQELIAAPTTRDTFHTSAYDLYAGNHTLYVQERDEAGNWSESGSWTLRIDTTAPNAPTVTATQVSPTREMRPTWTWTGGTGDSHRYYRYKLDSDDFRYGAKDTTGTTFRPIVDLSNGSHTLYVQERDTAGNWSSAGFAPMVIDTARPETPIVNGPTLTCDSTPTWTWSTATPGVVQFRYRLDNANLATGATTTTMKEFTPTANLSEGIHTLYVQESDAAGNWSDNGFRAIRLDLTKPAAPRIDSTPYSPLNSLRPKFTWRSGGGGARVFRVRIDNSELSEAPELTDSSFVPPDNLQEGVHTFYVQERDSAGNWSGTSQRVLVSLISGQVGLAVSGGGTSRTSLIVDRNNVPFVAYVEGQSPNSVRVKKNKGNGWEFASLPFNSPGPVSGPKLAMDNQNRIVLSYMESIEATGKYALHVFRLQGVDWISVGDSAVTTWAEGDETFLALDPDGVPYVTYTRWVETNGVGQNQAVLAKFAGTGWVILGTQDDAVSGLVVDQQKIPTLALSAGRIVQLDPTTNNWSPKVAGLPSESIRIYSLVQGPENTLILGFNGGGYQDRASFMRFANGTWSWLGNPGFTSNGIEDLVAHARSSGPIYAAFVDFGAANQISLAVLRGNQWEYVGERGKPFGKSNHPSLYLNELGVPLVSFVAPDGKAVVYQSGNNQP